ncbi:MAG: alpha/beta fold hydrolase [Actinomycetota bacterium]
MYLPLCNSRVKLSVGQIFWREVGNGGPDLVFLHGSWHESSQWLPVIEQLCPEYRCFAPDLLGFGDSSELINLHYSIEVEVECLAEYLETLKLRQVYLIGHSLGSWIATSYALKYPDRVRGLVLLAPEGVTLPNAKHRWQTARWLTSKLPVVDWLLRPLYPFAKLLGAKNQFDQLLQLRQQLRRSHAAPQLLFKRRWSEIQAELLDDRLSWLKVPTWILYGSEDRPTVVSLCQSYVAKAPGAELKSIGPGNSDLLQQMPHAIAQSIREFVQLNY